MKSIGSNFDSNFLLGENFVLRMMVQIAAMRAMTDATTMMAMRVGLLNDPLPELLLLASDVAEGRGRVGMVLTEPVAVGGTVAVEVVNRGVDETTAEELATAAEVGVVAVTVTG